jgi:hypothetical protein
VATFYGRNVMQGDQGDTQEQAHTDTALSGPRTNAEKWTVELITKLLELMHGEWLFHNIGHVRKEEIQMEILEEQQALGLGTAAAGILDNNITTWGNAI